MSNEKNVTIDLSCSREAFESEFTRKILDLKGMYEVITDYMATAGYFAVDENSGVEVNVVLALLEMHKPREVGLARKWFMAFFPLTEVKEKKVTIDGVEKVVKNGLKYSRDRHVKNFENQTAAMLFKTAIKQRFDMYKKLTTADTPRTPLTQEQLDKRLAKLREQAEQDKLVFTVPAVGTGTVVDNYRPADLFYALNNIPRAGLTPAQRQFIDETLGKAVALGFLDANTLAPSSSEEPAKEAAA